MITGDTIVAISSAVGSAARMIVRASGPDARIVASRVSRVPVPSASTASRVSLRFAGITVPAWLYVFHAPRSYTGEDLVEFHIPGNPLLARLLLDALISNGARAADAGEFTARAYFNGGSISQQPKAWPPPSQRAASRNYERPVSFSPASSRAGCGR
jgi:tRNA modification GTPase